MRTAAREDKTGKVGVFTKVSGDTHTKLTGLARDREITLQRLLQAILEWAGEINAVDLVRLGVRLPMWVTDASGLGAPLQPSSPDPVGPK